MQNNQSNEVFLNSKKSKTISSFNEKAIFDSLSKIVPVKKVKKKLNKNETICKRIKIISKKELEIENIKYYKYPFSPQIQNDGSPLFNILYEEWIVALTDLYKLYKSKKHNFYILFSNTLFIFADDIFCSLNFKEVLNKKKIKYVNDKNLLKILPDNDVLLFDYILNNDINVSDNLPFLLSKNPFINSMFYETKVIENKQFKFRNDKRWYYIIEGYLYLSDFVKYAENEIICEY